MGFTLVLPKVGHMEKLDTFIGIILKSQTQKTEHSLFSPFVSLEMTNEPKAKRKRDH